MTASPPHQTSAAEDPRGGRPGRGVRWLSGRWQRVLLAAGFALAVLIVAVLVDGLVLATRIRHLSVRFPAGGLGTTYVIAGSDTRTGLPASSGSVFGTASQVPGSRADVVLIVHQYAGKVSVLALPRDLLVSPVPGTVERLTLTYLQGPQALVDGLCNTLGIAASHVVVVDFGGFASIVNTTGGVTVDLPYPVRDPLADLSLPRAGQQHLNGAQALALVRSRTPQWLVGGKWVTVANGAVQRTDWAAGVLNALLSSVHAHLHDPLTVQSLAWDATGSLTTSSNTGLTNLVDLGRLHIRATTVRASGISGTLAVQANASTRAQLAAAGYGAHCQAPATPVPTG